MGHIDDKHVEWAVVNRLKAMLDGAPQTPFNVTQTFAVFSSILLWSKNRTWVAGNRGVRGEWEDPADHRAHDAREAMRTVLITAAPWGLSLSPPEIMVVGREDEFAPADPRINLDFENMAAEEFFKWLRDALAHGDGRTIRPIHKRSARTGKTLLAGFKIVFEREKGSREVLTLSLSRDDMRRIGGNLADLFCRTLSGNDYYFEEDAATRVEEQAA